MSSEFLKKLKSYYSYSGVTRLHFELKPKPSFNLNPVKSFSGNQLSGIAATQALDPRTWAFWEKIELLEDNGKGMNQEAFLPGCKYSFFPALQQLFGTDAPSSKNFLLHFGKNWEKNSQSGKLPVLLVPGAGDHAHRSFADPSYGIPGLNKNTGLAQFLDNLGYPVFAITFPHNQGDNFIQCEQLSNAIKRIRKLCNVNKVDLIAHSKGNIPARMYVSNIPYLYNHDIIFTNVRKVVVENGKEIEKRVNVIFPSKEWMSEFTYDVRRYIQLAAPNKGVDTVFRTFSSSAAAYLSKQAPIPFVKLFNQGQNSSMHETLKESIYYETDDPSSNNYFPGQCQILYDLAKEDVPLRQFSLPVAEAKPAEKKGEPAKTMKEMLSVDMIQKMYYGGHSMVGDSYGIEYAIAQGGMLIQNLRKKSTSSHVEIATITGTKSLVNVTFAGIPVPLMYEGVKGDGLLFYVSASDTEGISNSMGVYDFPVNHLEITYDDNVMKFIHDILSH